MSWLKKIDFSITITFSAYTSGQKVKPKIEGKYNLEYFDLQNSFLLK